MYQDVDDLGGAAERADGDGLCGEDGEWRGAGGPRPHPRLRLPAPLRHGRALLRGVLLPVP